MAPKKQTTAKVDAALYERLVQSVVDASTAPAKKKTYPKVQNTKFSDDYTERAEQLNQNPGLWFRLHPRVKSFILADVLEEAR